MKQLSAVLFVVFSGFILMSCSTSVTTKQHTTIKEFGELPFGRLNLRASEFENGRLSVKATFGGVCTLGGDPNWIIFPLYDETTSVPGPCTIMSPILGAVSRQRSELIETLKPNDVVMVIGILTQNHTMMGQNNQYSLEVESIQKIGQNKPASSPFLK